jgi:cytochrome P450
MLIQPAFARRGLSMWERWLRPRLDELIDRFEPVGRGNLYFDYCAQFPAYVTAKAFGVPDVDVELFGEWAALLQTGAVSPDEADVVSGKVVDYMQDIIDRRRHEPEEDLVSLLVTSEITDEDGTHKPSDEQILGLLRNIMPAGVGTTYRTLGIILVILLARPELLARVQQDASLAPKVIEEALRWSPPVTWMLRVATHDTVLAGQHIPAGAVVHACLAAANRDPAEFDDPDEFDIDRPPRQHLSFSIGPHFCIGAQVARMELAAALTRVLDRLPQLRADPAAEPPDITGLMFRLPTAVPAVWN